MIGLCNQLCDALACGRRCDRSRIDAFGERGLHERVLRIGRKRAHVECLAGCNSPGHGVEEGGKRAIMHPFMRYVDVGEQSGSNRSGNSVMV